MCVWASSRPSSGRLTAFAKRCRQGSAEQCKQASITTSIGISIRINIRMVIRRQTNIIHIVFIVIRTHIIIIIIVVSTAPRIPPHHPSQRRERSGAMGLVD